MKKLNIHFKINSLQTSEITRLIEIEELLESEYYYQLGSLDIKQYTTFKPVYIYKRPNKEDRSEEHTFLYHSTFGKCYLIVNHLNKEEHLYITEDHTLYNTIEQMMKDDLYDTLLDLQDTYKDNFTPFEHTKLYIEKYKLTAVAEHKNKTKKYFKEIFE